MSSGFVASRHPQPLAPNSSLQTKKLKDNKRGRYMYDIKSQRHNTCRMCWGVLDKGAFGGSLIRIDKD